MRVRLAAACAAVLAAGLLAGCGSSASGGSAGSAGAGSGSTSGQPGGPPQRVAELASVGGFVAPAAQALRPPQLVVYDDGTLVVDGTKRAALPAGDVRALVSALEADLDGQPPAFKLKRPVPDVGTTVIGYRQKAGAFVKIDADGLRELGDKTGYPAPLLDAFAKLDTVLQNAEKGPTTPYTADSLMLGYQCTGATAAKPLPPGLPDPGAGPTPSAGTCSETLFVTAPDAVQAVKGACGGLGSASVPATVYQSDRGPLTCQWRYALPDETAPAK